MFTASRYGEWLNQVIPCGSIAGVVNSNDPCITGINSLQGGSAQGADAPGAPPSPTKGALAIAQLLTGGSQG